MDTVPEVGPLLKGMPHALLLRDDVGDYHILVSSCPIEQPYVRSVSFSTSIVIDRRCKEWEENCPAKYFIYRVHSSYSFCMATSTAAALYLSLCKFLAREYEDCVKAAEACQIDVKMSDQEAFIFGLFR